MQAWTNKESVAKDGLSPMRRLLTQQTGNMVEVEYDQQWKTMFKAEDMGLVKDLELTDKGRAWIASDVT